MFSKSTRCNCSKNNGPDYGWEKEEWADRGITMTCNLIQIFSTCQLGERPGGDLSCGTWHDLYFISLLAFRSLWETRKGSLLFGGRFGARLHPDAIFCLSLLSTATRRPQFGYGAYDWHWLEPGKTNCAVWSASSPFLACSSCSAALAETKSKNVCSLINM